LQCCESTVDERSEVEAPPDERGGNRYVQPNATALHLGSTIADMPRLVRVAQSTEATTIGVPDCATSEGTKCVVVDQPSGCYGLERHPAALEDRDVTPNPWLDKLNLVDGFQVTQAIRIVAACSVESAQ
jgi:hypothetical protein